MPLLRILNPLGLGVDLDWKLGDTVEVAYRPSMEAYADRHGYLYRTSDWANRFVQWVMPMSRASLSYEPVPVNAMDPPWDIVQELKNKAARAHAERVDAEIMAKYEDDVRKPSAALQHAALHKLMEGIPQHEPGAKLDAGKVDTTLLQLFARALSEVCRVGDYGQNKYTRGGFLAVPDGPRRYTRAMLDHFFKEDTEGKFDQDPYYDTPEGMPWKNTIRHDAQVAWNALARLELRLREEAK